MSHSDDEVQIAGPHLTEKFLLRFTSSHLKELFPIAAQSTRAKSLVVKNASKLYFGLSYSDVAKLELDCAWPAPFFTHLQWFKPKKTNSGLLTSSISTYSGERFQPELDLVRLTCVLRDELSAFYHHYTSTHLFCGSTWIRINIDLNRDTQTEFQETQTLSNLWSTTYIICHPHGKYILVQGMLASQKKFIFHALQSGLKCHSIEPANLSGPNISSLIDLINNQQSQGAFRDYRLGCIDQNPLDRSEPKPVENPKPKELPNVVQEDQSLIEERNANIRKVFGSSNDPLPIIDHTDFKIELPYQPTGFSEVFPLSFAVRFSGENILEGLKECIQCGLIQTPIPSPFEQVAQAARNSFEYSMLHE